MEPPPPFPPPLLKYYYGYKPKIGRKLRVLLSRDSPKWHTAIVKSFVTSKNEWKKPSIVLEFFDNDDEDNDNDKKDGDVFSPGTYVEIQGLEKAHHHNGRCGIVLGQQQQIKQQKERRKKDSASSSSSSSSSSLLRYEVQISSNKDIDHSIILSIKPQNLIHKSLNDSNDGCVTGGGFQRSVYRIHPSIGGILIGKLKSKSSSLSSSSACSPDLVASSSEEEERISFEWIMGDDDDEEEEQEEKMIIKDSKEEHNNMVVVENDDDKIIDDDDVCDYCGKSKEQLQVDKLKKCTRCNDAWYCSRECQSKDWSNHKSYCNDIVSELKSKSKKSSISSSFQKGDHILIHGLVIDKSLSSERNGLYGMIMDSVPKCNDNQYQVRIAVRSDNNHNNDNNDNKNSTERVECELVAPDTEIIFVPKKNMKFVGTNIPPPILPMPMNEVIELTVATLGLDDPIFLKKVREKRKIQLDSDFLDHTLFRLMTNGDPIALGKFLLEADMLYIILEFGQKLFDLLLGPSCTLDTKVMIFCVSRYCEKIGLNTKTISDMPKQLYLYESWTISLATTIARDILLNPSHEVWPQALEWIRVSVELLESSISRSDLSGNIHLAEMKSNIACNYWELIKTHVKVGNFGKSMELFQEKTDLLKNMSGLDADWRIIFAYLGEWTTGTSKQFLLEDQKQRFRHDTKMLQRYLFTNFRIIENGTNATQNDLDRCYTNCPIHYPRFPFLLPVSQKILDRIQNKDVRDTYERMMDGDFTVDWKEKAESLHLHFSASSGPLRSEVVLSEMHIMPNLLLTAMAGITCPPGTKFQEGLTVAINSEGSFKKFLAEEERYKMAYRLAHIFLSRYASCLKIVDPKEVWQHFIEHYIEHKKWKDGYDAQIMLASLVMAENDTNSVTSKYVACIRAGESLEAMGKYQDAGSVYYEASKYFEPGPDFNKVNLVHNAGLAYKRIMQFELAEKYYVEALHYQSHLSKSADRWNYNHENCENIITSMIYNYGIWSAQDAGLDDDNKINRAFLPFVCLLYVSGFADKATGSKSHDEVIYYGLPISPVILKPQYRKKQISKEALFKALDTKNVEDFRSFMKDITLPACESITIEGQAYNGGNKQQLKEAARNQLLESSTLENTSTIVQNLCVQCRKSLPNMLQCPCKTVSYCGKECQVKHWRNGHKKLCPLKQ